MNKAILFCVASMACFCASGANVYTNSFERDGVTYVQRGVLTVKDYVVTNVADVGAVKSVNGKTGDVELTATDVHARPDNWNPDFIGTSYIKLWIDIPFPYANNAKPAFSIGEHNTKYLAYENDVIGATNSLPDWVKSSTKPTYTATEVGALPVDGIAQEANHAETADRANTAAYANESDNANYASSAGGVFWFDIYSVPSWIGDEKPTYTAEEVGAAPAKTTLVLGGPSSSYELRLNGVAQTFDQVSNYVAHGEVIARHLDGFYKPTYLSGSEMMFDCAGLMAGDVRTRRIHMLKSNNKVVLDDTKILAEEAWVLGLSTTYTNLAGSAFVSLNQSVQTVTVDGVPVTISMPTAVQGVTRDFVVYVNNTSAATDAPLVLPAGTYYADDDTATNAFTKGTVSALYITEMSGAFMIGRKELKQIVVQ